MNNKLQQLTQEQVWGLLESLLPIIRNYGEICAPEYLPDVRKAYKDVQNALLAQPTPTHPMKDYRYTKRCDKVRHAMGYKLCPGCELIPAEPAPSQPPATLDAEDIAWMNAPLGPLPAEPAPTGDGGKEWAEAQAPVVSEEQVRPLQIGPHHFRLAPGLEINLGDDGTWLVFKAHNGNSAIIRMENLPDAGSHIIKNAIQTWCEDFRALLAPQGAPSRDVPKHGGDINCSVKKDQAWLNKLRIRLADGWLALSRQQPYRGDKKLLLAHDMFLCARDLFRHSNALACVREEEVKWFKENGAWKLATERIAQLEKEKKEE
jgi:hypothetical protein